MSDTAGANEFIRKFNIDWEGANEILRELSATTDTPESALSNVEDTDKK